MKFFSANVSVVHNQWTTDYIYTSHGSSGVTTKAKKNYHPKGNKKTTILKKNKKDNKKRTAEKRESLTSY